MMKLNSQYQVFQTGGKKEWNRDLNKKKYYFQALNIFKNIFTMLRYSEGYEE